MPAARLRALGLCRDTRFLRHNSYLVWRAQLTQRQIVARAATKRLLRRDCRGRRECRGGQVQKLAVSAAALAVSWGQQAVVSVRRALRHER
jgi:hypothetical protein